MASDPTNLLWIDLETTGLNTATDHVLEVACFITDPDGTFPRYQNEWVIQPTDPTWYDAMVPFVKEMHEKSGLIQDINDKGIHLTEFIDDFGTYLQSQVAVNNGQKLTMAGSGVGPFDRVILKEQFPLFEAYLNYYVLDVGVIGRFVRHVCGVDLPDRPTVNHRAKDDIAEHYEEFQLYKRLLKS